MDRLRLCRHLSFYIYVSVNLMSFIYSGSSSRLHQEPLPKDLLITSNVGPEDLQRLLLPLSRGPTVRLIGCFKHLLAKGTREHPSANRRTWIHQLTSA